MENLTIRPFHFAPRVVLTRLDEPTDHLSRSMSERYCV